MKEGAPDMIEGNVVTKDLTGAPNSPKSGMFLVPKRERRAVPRITPKSRKAGMITLAAAALAAPLMWFAHALFQAVVLHHR